MSGHGETIRITGARQNNLKDVSLDIPKNRIVVFTGVSGSGKSSIVFDTVAVESQRQLNETFAWYIRNRLPRHERPDADLIDDLAPAVVVDQRPVGGNARSTVGTMTDIYSVLRVLFSRYGEPSAGEAGAYSFNDPAGMCPECDGLGRVARVDLDRFLDVGRSLDDGAILFAPFGTGSFVWQTYARSGLFDPGKPLRDYTDQEWDLLLHGKGFKVSRGGDGEVGGTHGNTYEGLLERFDRLYLKRDLASQPARNRQAAERVTIRATCPSCGGARLNAAALATRIGGHTIADLTRMEVTELIEVLAALDDPVAAPIAEAAVTRLRRLAAIGLGYLSLDRETRTVSGGEGQRLKVVRHLGSSLTGLTYIFDEPSVGLHPRDVGRLTGLLRELRDRGNTVLVVEHDPDVIAVADHVIDMGPGAGADGGQVVFTGMVERLRAADTVTGRALRQVIPVKHRVREPSGWLTVTGADLHNLRNLTARFPLGALTCVTGVAGSGKSTLVRELVTRCPEAVVVDQSAITASRRSSPATYLGLMDPIRRLFAAANGVEAGLFSHNSTGSCPGCEGAGVIYTDLAFMDPVTTVCRLCHGTRYRPEVARHTLRGHTIVEMLALTAEQALGVLTEPPLHARLRALNDVGLSYLSLGQPLSSLSGGERQRVKLAGRLRRTGELYVLDEPTTGLHRADVTSLTALLDHLVDTGNTVVVIEHDLDVVRRADHVIDLGPGGGRHGGDIVFTGPPSSLLEHGTSHTAEHLRRAVDHDAP